MRWGDLWKRVRDGHPAARLGGYEDLAPFAGRTDFFTATRLYPAEPATVYSFLLRVAADEDAEAVARLTWHARLIHQLQSPCLPQLTDLGAQDGRWYVAFRINAPLRVLPAPGCDGMLIVRQLAETLAYMHEQGLAHRGLCPSAIALSPSGVPLLFDLCWIGRFGTDRMVRSVLSRRPRTPYDAPEGGAEEFDGVRADIYSLGVLARELLPAQKHADLVESMTHEAPKQRPSSMTAVLRQLSTA